MSQPLPVYTIINKSRFFLPIKMLYMHAINTSIRSLFHPKLATQQVQTGHIFPNWPVTESNERDRLALEAGSHVVLDDCSQVVPRRLAVSFQLGQFSRHFIPVHLRQRHTHTFHRQFPRTSGPAGCIFYQVLQSKPLGQLVYQLGARPVIKSAMKATPRSTHPNQ